MSLRETEQQRRAVDDLRVLTFPAQCAEVLGVSKDTLLRLRKKGEGPIVTRISDRRIGVTVANLRRWQQSRERA
jgi:predicted DNA-binding transcriptional regulator AlpA